MSTDVQHGLKSKTLTFYLTSPEPRAWLVLTSDAHEALVVQMQQQDSNASFARVDLLPGAYRCRYYCGDDRNVIYYGPAHIEGGIDCGLDTLLSVKLPAANGTVLDHYWAAALPISSNCPPQSSE